jgi:hypothetical protein
MNVVNVMSAKAIELSTDIVFSVFPYIILLLAIFLRRNKGMEF